MRKLVLTSTLFSLSASLFAASPFVGTWKLNPKETKYTTGTPPKDVTLTIEEHGDELQVTATGAYPDGTAISVKYNVPERGGAAKVEQGPFDAMTAKRISARERLNTYTKDGKEIITRRFVVSKNGKELKETLKGTDQKGNPVDGIDQFDRQ